jgi:hypothetical protein
MFALGIALSVPAWGQAVGPEFQVNQSTTGRQYQYGRAVSAAPDGSFVVVWEEGNFVSYGGQPEIKGRRFDANGGALSGDFAINTYTTGAQYRASVATNPDGDFLVAWQSKNQDGAGAGVFGRAFAADGTPVGSDFQISQSTLGDQGRPKVTSAGDGSFVVAWLGPDGASNGVFARRFDGSGAALSSELLVNTYTSGAQTTPAITGDGSGGFVVAWAGPGSGDTSGVFARRFDGADAALAGAFQVNSYTTGIQYEPAVGADANGNFVVAWGSGTQVEAQGQDGSRGGIFAQRYDNVGSPLGSEVQVNTYTTQYQIRPAVGVAADGRFVVTWDSGNYTGGGGQDGSYGGIFGQLYEADGSPRDAEFRVNTQTASAQRFASVGMAGNGRFVVAWNSFYQDGSNFGVHAQRYTLGDATAPSVVVSIPNGGETWAAGTTQTVVWTATDDTQLDHFDVFLSRNSGASFAPTPICSAVQPDQSCDWLVSGPASSTARVKVVAYDSSNNTAEDTSDADFAITSPFVTVTAPDTSGIAWRAGDTHAIKFIHSLGKNQPVVIELNRDYPGGSWETIANPALTTSATSSNFNWLVTGPATNGASARVRVTSLNVPGVTDTNNVSFTITSRVRVTAPNTAVAWKAGTTKAIKWNHNYAPPHAFRIDIDRDGDLACEESIAASVVASGITGSYDWLVSGPGASNRICVTSLSDPLGTDQSDVAFTITP